MQKNIKSHEQAEFALRFKPWRFSAGARPVRGMLALLQSREAVASGLDVVNNVHYQEKWMGTLHRFGKYRLLVLGREHGVVHFHVAGPDCSFAMDAQTLEVLAGDPPPDVLRKVRVWAAANRQAILDAWQEMNG